MPIFYGTSQYTTVTSSSQKFTNACVVDHWYRLSSSTDAFFSVGATGGSASAGADSHFIPAGGFRDFMVESAANGFVHIIRDSADGKATLTLLGGVG
jgi:hypothetical protein